MCSVGHLLSPPKLGEAALCHSGKSAASAFFFFFSRKPEKTENPGLNSVAVFLFALDYYTHPLCRILHRFKQTLFLYN